MLERYGIMPGRRSSRRRTGGRAHGEPPNLGILQAPPAFFVEVWARAQFLSGAVERLQACPCRGRYTAARRHRPRATTEPAPWPARRPAPGPHPEGLRAPARRNRSSASSAAARASSAWSSSGEELVERSHSSSRRRATESAARIERVDGEPVFGSGLEDAIIAAGFSPAAPPRRQPPAGSKLNRSGRCPSDTIHLVAGQRTRRSAAAAQPPTPQSALAASQPPPSPARGAGGGGGVRQAPRRPLLERAALPPGDERALVRGRRQPAPWKAVAATGLGARDHPAWQDPAPGQRVAAAATLACAAWLGPSDRNGAGTPSAAAASGPAARSATRSSTRRSSPGSATRSGSRACSSRVSPGARSMTSGVRARAGLAENERVMKVSVAKGRRPRSITAPTAAAAARAAAARSLARPGGRQSNGHWCAACQP